MHAVWFDAHYICIVNIVPQVWSMIVLVKRDTIASMTTKQRLSH